MQLTWIDRLLEKDRMGSFNWTFFTHTDSREPEQAGILGAIIGSAFTLIVTLVLAFHRYLMSAVYLEEFAPRTVGPI